MNEKDDMPAIAEYMALAEAIHDEDDTCLEGGQTFESCAWREYDIELAVKILVRLRKDDWRMVREPVGVAAFGLV